MALDTQQKRASVLEVPGIQELPTPDASIINVDRMMVSDLFGGLTPPFDDFFFWRRDGNDGQQWTQAGAGGNIFSSSQPVGNNWVKVAEVDDEA